MYPILSREELAPKIVKFVVEAPHVARKRKPGQFVIVRTHEHGERIPISVADVDAERGTITLVVQEVGTSSGRINAKQSGDSFLTIAGPLGQATEIKKFGWVVGVGGGVGIPPLHAIAKGMKEAGNRVTSILGGRTAELVLMRKEMAAASDDVLVCTDDGSLGTHGRVTDVLRGLMRHREKPALVVAIGPPIMMKKVSELTREFEVPTVVSLNSLMVDGTGMCGGCRVSVGGEVRFVCVDGPEFDGHEVDFDEMMTRLAMYKEMERKAYERWQQRHPCHLDRALGPS